MSEADHIKTPWVAEPTGPWSGWDGWEVFGPDRQHIADINGSQREPDRQAYARLIAAAPELLQVANDFQEALQELGLFCECGEADCRTTRLRSAIAKATGQPHE